MNGASDDLRQACAAAIGEIGGGMSIAFLSELLRDEASEQVAASGASALSLHGAFEAAWEIVPRLHRTQNPVLRTQLAIALANLLGRPGEFYRYVTGSEEQQQSRQRKLTQEAIRASRTVLGTPLSRELALARRYDSAGSGRTVDRERLMQTMYAANPRLGLWYWFLNRTIELETESANPPNIRLELLVALYHLRTGQTTGA